MGNKHNALPAAKSGVIGGGIGLAATPLIMTGVGFGAKGIIAGSLAASAQAGIGNVVAGSLFAVLTSIGMTSILPLALVGGFFGYLIGAALGLI